MSSPMRSIIRDKSSPCSACLAVRLRIPIYSAANALARRCHECRRAASGRLPARSCLEPQARLAIAQHLRATVREKPHGYWQAAIHPRLSWSGHDVNGKSNTGPQSQQAQYQQLDSHSDVLRFILATRACEKQTHFRPCGGYGLRQASACERAG